MSNYQTKHPIEQLTDKQTECLRLVAQFMSSKEIGRALGITHHAVDQRLKTALQNLGVQNRQEAARLLVDYENPNDLAEGATYGRAVYGRSDLTIDPVAVDDLSSSGEKSPLIGDGNKDMFEDNSLILSEHKSSTKAPSLSALIEIGMENRLSIRGRTLMIALIAFGCIAGLALLVIIGERLSDALYKVFS